MASAAAGDGLPPEHAHERTAALYREHGGTVQRICRARLFDRGEAEDAVQQVFLSAHRALLNGSEPLEPEVWLATIARNECRERLRALASRPVATPSEQLGEVPVAPADPILAADVTALWREIALLPPAQRDAFLLREIRGLSYEHLADRLALSPPAVRSLLRRARERLRTRLAGLSTAIGGVSWLEGLARLVAGSGGGAAVPTAAKVVAVSVGAAALGGGALVVPSALHHRLPADPPAAVPSSDVPRTAMQHRHSSKGIRQAAAPIPAEPVASARPVLLAPRPSHVGSGGEDAGRDDQAPAVLPVGPAPVVLPRSGEGKAGSDGGGDGRDGGDGGSRDGGDSTASRSD